MGKTEEKNSLWPYNAVSIHMVETEGRTRAQRPGEKPPRSSSMSIGTRKTNKQSLRGAGRTQARGPDSKVSGTFALSQERGREKNARRKNSERMGGGRVSHDARWDGLNEKATEGVCFHEMEGREREGAIDAAAFLTGGSVPSRAPIYS